MRKPVSTDGKANLDAKYLAKAYGYTLHSDDDGHTLTFNGDSVSYGCDHAHIDPEGRILLLVNSREAYKLAVSVSRRLGLYRD